MKELDSVATVNNFWELNYERSGKGIAMDTGPWGQEEGGWLWAVAPFIAAACQVGVPCFQNHGVSTNSCYQQAPGCLQQHGCRHHPIQLPQMVVVGTKYSGKASVFKSLVGKNCFREALPLSPEDLSFCSSFMFYLKINGK